jgi:hypothetical protein
VVRIEDKSTVLPVLYFEAFVRRDLSLVSLKNLMISRHIVMDKQNLLDQVYQGGLALLFRVKLV